MKLESSMYIVTKINNKSGKSSIFNIGDWFYICLKLQNTSGGYGITKIPRYEVFMGNQVHEISHNNLCNLLKNIEYNILEVSN